MDINNEYIDPEITEETAPEENTEENQPVETAETEETSDSGSKSFDELTDDEQLEVLKGAFFNDENEDEGSDEGTEDDGEPDKPEEKAEEEPEQAPEETQESTPELYTPNEYLLLDPTEVDPSRLPEGARIVHERNMKYYNQVIAPQLEELRQLREYRDKTMNREQEPVQAPAQNNAPDFASISKAIKAEAARRLGVEEIDEFDADHNIMVSLVAGEYQRNVFQAQANKQAQYDKAAQMQQSYNQLMGELAQEYGPEFNIIDKWALEEINNLPKKVYDRITTDFKSGDPVKIKQIYRELADRYRSIQAQQKNQAKPAPAPAKKKVELPKVIGGSRGTSSTKSSWGISDFRKANKADQQRMIAETFFK